AQIVLSRAGHDLAGHGYLNAHLLQRSALGLGGHTDVPVGEKADRSAQVIDYRNSSARLIPHYLRGLVQRISRTAGFDVTIHDLLNFHRRLSVKSTRMGKLLSNFRPKPWRQGPPDFPVPLR